MTQFGHNFVAKLMTVLKKAIGPSLLVVLIFILQYLLDLDFKCSCKPGIGLSDGLYYGLYLGLPPLILTWVLFYFESFGQRSLSRCFLSQNERCSNCQNCLSFIFTFVLKLVFNGGIWLTAVFFEGDWFFCFSTRWDSKLVNLPCKDTKLLSEEEKETINGIKIESFDIGFGIISVLLFLWTVTVVVKGCCIRKTRQKNEKQLRCPPYYKVVYENLLKEQVNVYLKNELKEIATKRAEIIGQTHIQDIQYYEETLNADITNTSTESRPPTVYDLLTTVDKAWQTISALDFYYTPERRRDPSGEPSGEPSGKPSGETRERP